MLNPGVFEKAQRIIDEQIGRDRLIEPSDRENLPYISCLLKEVLRCVYPAGDRSRADPFLRTGGVSPCHWVSTTRFEVTGLAQEAKVSRTF